MWGPEWPSQYTVCARGWTSEGSQFISRPDKAINTGCGAVKPTQCPAQWAPGALFRVVWIVLRLKMSGAVSPFPIHLLDEKKETCLLTTVMPNCTSFQFFLLLSWFISLFNQLDAQNLFQNKFYFIPIQVSSGNLGSTVVKVLCYKSEGRWFDPSWCHWIFHWHKILPIALRPWGRLSL